MDNTKQQSNFSRQANSKACQSVESNRKSTDCQTNKPWPRSSRGRENPSASKNDQSRNTKQQSTAKNRPNVDKRPRQRGGGGGGYNPGVSDGAAAIDGLFPSASTGLDNEDYGVTSADAHGALSKNLKQQDYVSELNSVYATGSKKQNLNHLLNFHYASRESDNSMGISVFGRGGSTGMSRAGATNAKKSKYNKEQFMQANFQFVIKSSTKLKLNASPDTLIDWNLIEQINIQTTEEPQCPICLYPPIAAKLTRCGHAYCWPCILHYLALSDKTWRKCPICYEAVHIADLKSTMIVQQQPFTVGDKIALQLMRREKGSMFFERYTSSATLSQMIYPPRCSADDESKLFSKFLIAKRADILDIIERERRELLTGEDSTCPEFVFIQQALDLLKERREKLGDFVANKIEEDVEDKSLANEEPSVAAIFDKSQNYIENDTENAVAFKTTPSDDGTPINYKAEPENTISLNNLTTTSATTKYYYFYQSVDGQNIYLHPLNIKMLQACYGTLDQAPLLINARILQKEHHSMNEDHRRKFTCLSHLPLTCQFAVVEVDLQPPLITEGILKLFKDDILFRKKERQRRDREERKRERHIDEINDRQMGKLISSTANINLSSSHEFPTCGFEESLVGTYDLGLPRSSAISAATNHNATYSSVAVVGSESPKFEWPTLASPTANTYNSYQALSTWGKKPAATALRPAPSDRSSECGSLNEVTLDGSDFNDVEFLQPKRTNLGDVLAEALSQKKQGNAGHEKNSVGGNNKKNKKIKKMQPLFSTGMNYNGK